MSSAGGKPQKAGAVAFGGHNNAASANFTVGAVGFGPQWSAEDSMAASIVRFEQENDELRAEAAVLKQGMTLLAEERDEERLRVRSLNAFAESLVKTVGELKAELAEARFSARAGMTAEEMRADFLKEWRRDK